MTVVTNDTRLIKLDTGEYPVFLEEVRTRTGSVFGSTIESSLLEGIGYAPVLEVARPESPGVVTEGTPEMVEGQYRRVWLVRDYNTEETSSMLKQAKEKAFYDVELFRISQFKIGFPHLFNEGNDILHVQVRDQDRVNILARYTKAKEAITAGLSDKKFEFRVWENISVFLTPQEMVDMADAADEQVEAGYRAIWALKHQIESAASISEIPALPDSLFTL